jgi:RHS repeat-associated protein
VLERTCASLPFGDGLVCSGSTTTPTEHHFTGKERDAESGNDYFLARYFASGMGRFLTPDWSAKVEPVPYAKMDDPQSLNLYAYVLNNPLVGVDADGHGGPCSWSFVKSACDQILSVFDETQKDFNSENAAQTQVASDQQSIQQAQQQSATPPADSTQVAQNNTPSTPGQVPGGGDKGIVNVTLTTAALTTKAGAAIGTLTGGAQGAATGAAIGSSLGIGVTVNWVPSTNSLYAGWIVSAALLNGGGASVSYVFVPTGQNPNKIANGTSYSFSSNTPIGGTIVKSPGNGPPVVGLSFGTRVPVSVTASHSWCI